MLPTIGGALVPQRVSFAMDTLKGTSALHFVQHILFYDSG